MVGFDLTKLHVPRHTMNFNRHLLKAIKVAFQ